MCCSGFTPMAQANAWLKMSWLGGIEQPWLGRLRVLGPCRVPLPCRGLGKAHSSPWASHRRGCKPAGKACGHGLPWGAGAASPRSTGQTPVGFLPEKLSCCEDKLETIWKRKSIPAQCRASLIASLSAFNCNELYGSARRGAEPLG